jgi:nicotinate-nucleotide--dimethylbenzimidazole phosphoribosyltransferase
VSHLLERTVALIHELDSEAMRRAEVRQSQLTKPAGSLGRLELLSVQLAGITGTERPRLHAAAIVVMAADHGVTAERVSAYPASVTVEMVRNVLAGGAAINALARAVHARVIVVDMGTFRPATHDDPRLILRRIAAGTANLATGPAMTPAQALTAVEAGIEIAENLAARRVGVICAGEMGIGNTTAASAIIAAVTGRPAAAVTGRGTGLDDAGLARKVEVIERALDLNRPDPSEAFDVLAKVGGFEIGGLVGIMLGAARRRRVVLVDGLISTAAALLAVRLSPSLQGYLIAAHRSVEPGHQVALDALGLEPLLELDLRLGEGSGAALAVPIVRAAARTLAEMATFEEAAVSRDITSGELTAGID